MHVIVTGATGFLGMQTCRLLKRHGMQISAIGRNMQKGLELQQMGCAFFQVDLEDEKALRALPVLNADAIVHAAALSSAWGKKSAFESANIAATRHMLALAERIGAKRFVFISSPSLYFRWSDQLNIHENAPLPPPINSYAASKRQAEEIVLSYPQLSPIILRPRAIYGAEDTALLPRLIRAAEKGPLPLFREGNAATNLTYVDDVAESIRLSLLVREPIKQRIFNIACNEALPIRSIVERAAKEAGSSVSWKKIPIRPARIAVKIMEWAAALKPSYPEPIITTYGLGIFAYSQTLDTEAAKTVLGFEAKTHFEEGLEKTFATGKPML